MDAFLTGYKLAAIGSAEITRYIAKRQAQPTQMAAARDVEGKITERRLTSNGTINRELGVLGRMLRLGYENGELVRMPIIRKLKDSDLREASLRLTGTIPATVSTRSVDVSLATV